MSTKQNDIWLEAQEELKAETLEEAVDEEVEESEISRLAHENCTPEDYS